MATTFAAPSSESTKSRILTDPLWAKVMFLASVSFFSIPFVYYAFTIGMDFVVDGKAEHGVFETQNPTIALYLIALHMVFGASMNFLAPFQVYLGLTQKHKHLHRYVGIATLSIAAFGATAGTLYFSMYRDINFGTQSHALIHVYQGGAMYGVVMFYVLFKCVQSLFQKQYTAHKEWAIRLFILAIGSWINRVTTGWIILFFIGSNAIGIERPFNPELIAYVTPWSFYIVPLIIYEIYVRMKRNGTTKKLPTWAPFAASMTGIFILGIGTTGYIIQQMYL